MHAPSPFPYREPVARPIGGGAAASPSSKWFYLALAGLSALSAVVGVALATTSIILEPDAVDPPPIALAGMGLLGVAALLFLAKLVIAVVWLHAVWSWLPPEQRYTSKWGSWITPGTAIGFLFIPYFNLYWMFVMSMGLCEALDRMRASYPSNRRAPKGIALAASICQIVPGANLVVAPFVWFFFMHGVDAAIAALEPSVERARRTADAR